MDFQLRKAERKQAKIKMGLQGPSGSGKTTSGLLLAYGLVSEWGKIGIIDCENNSADLYAHLGDFRVLDLEAPFTPERYIEAINICENAGMQVIIIDSISPEWETIVEIHGSMLGNSFSNWGKVLPRHTAFIQKILQSNCHIIATIRSKQDYVLSEKNGKMVPEKVGLKGVARENTDFELTLVFELDIKHLATCTKDRTNLFMDKPPFMISPKTGLRIAEWCNSGSPIAEKEIAVPTKPESSISSKIKMSASVDELYQVYVAHQDQWNKELTIEYTARKREINSKVVNLQNFNQNGNAAPLGSA